MAETGELQVVRPEDRAAAIERAVIRLDTSKLTYGSLIPAEQIEEACGISRNHAVYGLVVLHLQRQIEAELQKRDERGFIVRRQENGLRVLTNSEAAVHGLDMCQQSMARADRWFYKTTVCVDTTKLSAHEREAFERRRLTVGKMLLHVKEVQLGGDDDV